MISRKAMLLRWSEAVRRLAKARKDNLGGNIMKVKWELDGSLCPICSGAGRGSARYPAALCEPCQASVVDSNGNRVALFNQGLSGGLEIKTLEDASAVNPEEMPLFAKGVECRAQEHRFGGVVVQPLEAWQAFD